MGYSILGREMAKFSLRASRWGLSPFFFRGGGGITDHTFKRWAHLWLIPSLGNVLIEHIPASLSLECRIVWTRVMHRFRLVAEKSLTMWSSGSWLVQIQIFMQKIVFTNRNLCFTQSTLHNNTHSNCNFDNWLRSRENYFFCEVPIDRPLWSKR